MTTRAELVLLAEAKRDDARLLLEHGRWANSYYLYGYAVELLLKAIVAGQFRAEEIPDRKLVESTYTHDLARLVVVAKLSENLGVKRRDEEFARRWSAVLGWSETARYRTLDPQDARGLAEAVEHEHGVYAWLAAHLSNRN